MAQLKDLIVAGSSRFLGKLFLEDTVTLNDSLILTKNAEADAKSDNKPALIIGDPVGEHLEFDGNEIMAKKTGTTASTLFINYGEGGGLVEIGPGGLKVGGTTTLSGAATAASTITTTYGQASNSSTTGDIRVGGGIYAAKTSFFDTTLYTGTTSFYILGDSTSKLKNLELTGTLKVTGATTLSSTLGVTGATTLKSTLGVTGATTLSSTLTTNGATTLKSTLTVESGTTLKSTLGVTGIATFSNGEAGSNGKGAVRITGGLSTTNTSWFGGGLITVHNSSSGDSAIVFDRGTSANWKIVDSSATLHFQSDWNADRSAGSEKGTYETLAKLAHTTGHLTLKGTLYVANGTTYYINGSTSKLNALTTVGAITVGTNIVPDATYSSSNTANNIGTSSARWNALYIQTLNAAGNATISGNTTMAGTLSITSGADSSSMTTGALKVQAGIGATGQITAKQFMVNDKATMKYDTTNDYVYFTFA